MNREVENLTSKPITEFVPGDTIYITKMVRGHQFTHLCKFASYERGIVTGDVISFEPSWAYHPMDLERGIQVRARLSRCYLWGKFSGDVLKYPHCHWFDGKTKKVAGAV